MICFPKKSGKPVKNSNKIDRQSYKNFMNIPFFAVLTPFKRFMYIFKRIKDLQNFLAGRRSQARPIGFVPTMGALHAGHLSLLDSCRQDDALSVCSIFVNPTQFNDPNDYASYPITLESDIHLLETNGCEVLFLPEKEEIYPASGLPKLHLDLGGLDQPMEGAFRPGHFEGVVQVVNRLLDIVCPDMLYMGQKDFQQWSVIHKMLEQVHRHVQLKMCPVFREKDGLAMSSRNRRLTSSNRELAPLIFKTMLEAAGKAPEQTFSTIRSWAEKQLYFPAFKLEYFDFVDAFTLQPLEEWDESDTIVLCVAVWLGDVRLIDTLFVKGEPGMLK